MPEMKAIISPSVLAVSYEQGPGRFRSYRSLHLHFILYFLPLPYPLHRLDRWKFNGFVALSTGEWGLVVGPLIVDERDQDDHVRRGGLVSYGCHGRVSPCLRGSSNLRLGTGND
jgi:hypothetical protein